MTSRAPETPPQIPPRIVQIRWVMFTLGITFSLIILGTMHRNIFLTFVGIFGFHGAFLFETFERLRRLFYWGKSWVRIQLLELMALVAITGSGLGLSARLVFTAELGPDLFPYVLFFGFMALCILGCVAGGTCWGLWIVSVYQITPSWKRLACILLGCFFVPSLLSFFITFPAVYKFYNDKPPGIMIAFATTMTLLSLAAAETAMRIHRNAKKRSNNNLH